MRDDIMRLAERVAEMDIVCNMTHLAARDLCEMRDAIAAELRALARTDHSEDKLGMVAAEANEWAFEDKKHMRGDYAAAAGWNACRAAMLAAAPAPDHSLDFGNMVTSKPGSWPEDFSHENGNYECKCCHCGATFYGHKRRVTCKVCASPAPDHSAGVGGMVSAAKAVIQRWDSPLWREQTSTAALINDLREAVNALAQPVTAGADGGK